MKVIREHSIGCDNSTHSVFADEVTWCVNEVALKLRGQTVAVFKNWDWWAEIQEENEINSLKEEETQ